MALIDKSTKEKKEENSVSQSLVRIQNHKKHDHELTLGCHNDILSGFLDNGFALPHSCRQAMCGKCAARLIEGKVVMRENYALNEAKINAGYVLLCQSIPITEKIVLEYDD